MKRFAALALATTLSLPVFAAPETYVIDPLQDPAVLVMGAFIAFHTNADVNSYGGYRCLIQRCADRDQLYKDQMNDAH